jgi:NAD(P)H-flavin reductase
LVADKDGATMRAIIIECRLDKEIFKNRTLEEVREDVSVYLKEASYEYYVHYEHMNRRLDEWIKWDRITKTDEFIDMKKIKAANKAKGIHYSSDEEYDGLDKNAR